MKETICWDCQRATGFCAWSHDFKVVKGWKAIPTKVQRQTAPYDEIDSYLVLECPLFLADKPRETHMTIDVLAKILGVTARHVPRVNDNRILEVAKQKNIKLRIEHTKGQRRIYKIEGEDKL